MKKYILFTVFTLCTGMLWAEDAAFTRVPVRMHRASDKVLAAETHRVSNVLQNDFEGHDYYSFDGMMHGGLCQDFSTYPPYLLSPLQDSLVFHNWYGPTTWYIGDTQYAADAENLVLRLGRQYAMNAVNALPRTEAHNYVVDGVTRWWAGYGYGESEPNSYLGVAMNIHDINKIRIPMTLCAMYGSVLEEDGADMFMQGGGAQGDYAYGTNLRDKSGKRIDKMGIVVRNDATMLIDSLYIPIYNEMHRGIGTMLPSGSSVMLRIYAVEDGQVCKDKLIAETSVTAADFIAIPGKSYIGTFTARFYRTNELGITEVSPLYVSGDFYLELSNYNETYCDFGIYSDDYCPLRNTTFYELQDGTFTTLWEGGTNNLAISFDAIWPVLRIQDEQQELLAPQAGGELYYQKDAALGYSWLTLLSNYHYEDLLDEETGRLALDLPDWIHVAGYDDENYYINNRIGFVFMADANEGYDRSCQISFMMDNSMRTSVTVRQAGPLGEGVELMQNDLQAPVKVVRDGQLLIQRGACVYNTQGQIVM